MSTEADATMVIVGMDCRLPGADGLTEFESMLFDGRSGIAEVPEDRFDRSLYFNPRKGLTGRSYTTLGGCVPERSPDRTVCPLPESLERLSDPAHVQFCEVAARAWKHAGLSPHDARWMRTGVYVGHSGGTRLGGPMTLATQIEDAVSFLQGIDGFDGLAEVAQREITSALINHVRQSRPQRTPEKILQFSAYQAASLVAQSLGLAGPRSVIDAACASSLLALSHAMMAIRAGRIDSALVGGATYNGVDNLILFSHSQACSESGSRPFDEHADGLVSSEGYVAVVLTTAARAKHFDLPVRGIIRGIGVASDGRGRSLWAPRKEGQQLALRRAYQGTQILDIDYLEAHATSTQLGDATELATLCGLAEEPNAFRSAHPLLLGSVKSNIGHTLEAAGLVGLVKVLISMQRNEIAPSLNFREPNSRCDWDTAPVEVVDRRRPWQKRGRTRRAGVSAFGIGGLNAHVHLAEPGPIEANRIAHAELLPREPIAIIGRGVVLPGALNVDQFGRLLQSGRSAISGPSPERWAGNIGVVPDAPPAPHRTPTNDGGYISNFAFDGQKYRIPPKQIWHANPAQMMLIDAVAQAASECDNGEWTIDRQRTAVVIGSIFGGEFGDQLQVGMRLPEICRELVAQLRQHGVDGQTAESIAQNYRKVVLSQRPALLDETGSFTASTLASRIAKTFDLMGGACALDGDDASGLSALLVAVDQLRAGVNDFIICGSAQRTMNLASFEELDLKGRLVRSGRVEDIPDDCSRVLPGEGVVALLLCRLSDARKAGYTIRGIVDDVQTAQSQQEFVRTAADADLVRRIGYLSGTHGLVRIVAETLDWESRAAGRSVTSISSAAHDGYTVQTRISRATDSPALTVSGSAMDSVGADKERQRKQEHGRPFVAASKPELSMPRTNTKPLTHAALRVIRLSAASPDRMLPALDLALRDVARLWTDSSRAFSADQACRVAVLAESQAALAAALTAVRKAWEDGRRCGVLERHRSILWQAAEPDPRIAWLFPGQGSQYSGCPSALNDNPAAKSHLAEVDRLLELMRLSPLLESLHDDNRRLGRDVWWTQLWALGSSTSLVAALRHEGLHPDVVLGHSFGEFSASVASGILTLQQALEISRHRSDAVVTHTRERGALLSVRGSLSEVDAALQSERLAVWITHHNGPRQTVIAGAVEAVESAKRVLSAANLASVVIPVPAAFHTPLLADAEAAFRRLLGSETLRPPKCGFLSATSGQYLAEPDAVRESLVTQLTRPVLYVPSIRRLLADGCRLLLEVGPNDVLTRMNRDIVDDEALCLSLDVPGQSAADRMLMVKTALECVSGNPSLSATTAVTIRTNSTTAPRAAPVTVFDVTNQRQDSPYPNRVSSAAAGAVTQEDSHRKPVALPVAADNDPVRRFLLDLVVELTGYSPDVLDFEAELEADLGLDSIKKAQILGELGEWAGLQMRPDSLRLDDIRTLADAAAFAETALARPGTSLPDPMATPAAPASMSSVPEPMAATSPTESTESADDSDLAQQLETLLIDFVVDQTGYSRDIVDLDADLESDLGLDSIKQAQLIGELKEQFDLQDLNLERVARADFRTLRAIRHFLMEEIDDTHSSLTVIAPSVPAAEIETAAPPRDVMEMSPKPGGVDPIDAIPDEWIRWFQPNSRTTHGKDAWQIGYELGQQRRNEIRAALRTLVDCGVTAKAGPVWGKLAQEEFRGLAAGAGVAEESIQFAAGVFSDGESHSAMRDGNGSSSRNGKHPQDSASHDETPGPVDRPATRQIDESGTHRFSLRVVPAPRRDGMPSDPELSGPALILGSGSLANALASRIRRLGQQAILLDDLHDANDVESRLQSIFAVGPTPHLFLATPHETAAANELDPGTWKARRRRALEIPFRLCQLWMQSLIDADAMDDASVVAVTRLGGDFGFSGRHVQSIEGVGGLVKAMLIECWMRGFRSTPMKVIDICPDSSADEAAAGILCELAVPSYDMEIAIRRGERFSVQAFPQALDVSGDGNTKGRAITRGGQWILSGGGRGITAMTGMELARRHDLTLHLLGTAPVPDVSEEMRKTARSDRSALRRQVMREASSRGENPVEFWRNTEKAIEIDITLQECRRRNIRATYYCCDVSDFESVAQTLDRIRQTHGPISGILHGAGAGQDSRFDRKRPDKVDKCLKAKIDGALALMHATQNDPLEWFAAFGSISGRFGANGHTDYSLANDAMAKIIDRYRVVRPDVSSVTFHWHAWGDVGMATKPEAKLALEMIDMEFMPAEDGVRHFLAELEHGGDEPEVLITDLSYFRKFFPAERIAGEDGLADSARLPLLHGPSLCSGDFLEDDADGAQKLGSHVVTLDPVADRFLSQHRIQNRPTLPFVVALELMAEAARCLAGQPVVVECRDAHAIQAIRFPTDDSLAVTVDASQSGAGTIDCSLLADVRRRDGRLVEENRKYFSARFELADALTVERTGLPGRQHLSWESIPYSEPGAAIYHGPELQELRLLAVDGTRAWGRIAASAPVQLFGAERTRGFTVPCSSMDACLYAVAVFAWKQQQKASLPVSFGRIRFGRIPDPGEPCLVRIDHCETQDHGASFNFRMFGLNGDILLDVEDYRLAWLSG